jgi:hypothetical protein
MDKLEPILKHHFWILLVPLLSMNLWGYFSANSALSAATSARQTALDGVKSKIPTGQNDPNEQYAEELKTQNDALEKFVKEELQQLWLRQQARMTWPQAVAADIPKGYRSEVTDNLVRFAYQNVYFQDVIKPLHESVEPMVLNTKDLTYVPKVDFPLHLIPQMKVGNFTITSTQMWDAQEDVWVTQLILDAIRQMNKDADSTSSAVIRRVVAYRLLGGDGTPVTSGGAGAASGDASGMMMPGDMEGSSGAASGGGGGRSKVKTSVKFNPAEEFGTGGEALASGNGMSGGEMMSSMMPAEGEVADGSATGVAEVLRYVKFDPASTYEAAPFMERGFYLSVIINQNRLVDFLVALSNSDWPIKVARFHIGKNPYRTDEFKSSGATGGGLASGGGMMGSMMAPGFDTSSPMPFGGSGDPNSSMLEDYSSSGLPGGMGGGAGAGANTGYKVTDLDHPDLIQLDLAGLVTIFRDPAATADGATTEETPADGTPPADATAGEAAPPADGTAPANPEATVPMPAAEAGAAAPAGDAGATAPAGDAAAAQPGPTEPAVESPSTAEPAATEPSPAEPATTEPAATEPAKPDPAEPPANP